MIVVDDREPENIRATLYKEGVRVKVARLTIGDYIIGDMGIERKTTGDLYRSIIDRRLFDQLNRLKEAYSQPAVIIEGDLSELLYTVSNPQSILGALVSMAIDYSIPIIYSRDEGDTARILIYIWRKLVGKRRVEASLRYKPKVLSDKERLEFILQGFPNIGPRLAKNILNHYKTIRALATTTLSELKTIEGLGEKRAQEIYRLLNLDYTNL